MVRIVAFILFASIGIVGCSAVKTYENNHIEHPDKSFFSYLWMRWFTNEEWAQHKLLAITIPVSKTQTELLHSPEVPAQVTWVGHSTFLLQVNGVNVLTDPIFSYRASPVGFAGPERLVALPLTLEQLPPIDVVVISHNHYDHLDEATIKALGDGPKYYVPQGLTPWFLEQGIAEERIVELAWWQAAQLDESLTVTAMPSQHWSSRSLFDRHQTHWASWHLQFADFSVWFAGDTGYNPKDFKAIGEYTGGVDVAMIPIGGWKPRSFMSAYHVNEAEALQIHHDIKSKYSIGMHWGTFPLTAEGPDVPRRNLASLTKEMVDTRFDTMEHGTTRTLVPRASK